MKLHEREDIETPGCVWAERLAAPGGWVYLQCVGAHNEYGGGVTSCFVPDPTAEHVTQSAANVAATGGAIAGYAKAIADCWEVLDAELKADSVPLATRMKLLAKLKGLSADNAAKLGNG